MYMSSVLEALGLAELEHNPKNKIVYGYKFRPSLVHATNYPPGMG